jgi:putative tryptophan/tyrosine transport system substrate-binding protein
MKRSEFVAWIAAVLLAPFSAAFAQVPDREYRIGVLGPAEQPRLASLVAGLREGLRLSGYGEAGIRILEAPVPRGDPVAAEAAARQLRQQGAAVILAIGSEMARPARKAAPDAPIVFISPGDPVASGLVESFARPGGNMTGMTFEFPELSGKRLELIRDVAGPGARVAVVFDPKDASSRQGLDSARRAATALGMTLLEAALSAPEDTDAATAKLAGAQALLVIPGGAAAAQHVALLRAAHDGRVMTMFPARNENTREAVLAYGARDVDIARDAARLIDRILKGTDAGTLPVERPTRFQFSVNLKTARALGVNLPPAILAFADEVIE